MYLMFLVCCVIHSKIACHFAARGRVDYIMSYDHIKSRACTNSMPTFVMASLYTLMSMFLDNNDGRWRKQRSVKSMWQCAC